ncbi:dihydrodipicolinate synthase family protein [Jiangella asiatica]|uniref:dihydrodipicolinate synthase family protein n=1 Tax=Jiangella asiatica TaxID=2530372 RepID=UPI0013A5C3F3|nr:dihydrodipicolinate synthase family protein [Jiangella asiatica]
MHHEAEFWAATFTPFTEAGRLDLGTVPAYAKHLAARGVHGAFVAGTTGEFPAMSTREREDLLAAWAAHRPPGFGLAVQVGHTDLREAQRLAAHAAGHGVDLIASVAPYYGQADLDRTVAWLGEVSAAAPRTPFCLYHIPSRTGSTLNPAELVRAAAERIPTLAAVKFTDPDLFGFTTTREVSERVRVYYGCDELLPAALGFGADGFIGSLYNFLAPIAHAVVAATAAGDPAGADRLHRPFREVVVTARAHGGLAVIKELANALGPDTGPCRPPAGALGPSGRDAVDMLASRLREALDGIASGTDER